MPSSDRMPRERYLREEQEEGHVFALIVLAVAQAVFFTYERWSTWRREAAWRREEPRDGDVPKH